MISQDKIRHDFCCPFDVALFNVRKNNWFLLIKDFNTQVDLIMIIKSDQEYSVEEALATAIKMTVLYLQFVMNMFW